MVKIVTGMRRSGKSYLLFTLLRKHLIDSGVNEAHIISIDLENIYNERLREPLAILDHIKQQMIDGDDYYVLIDEIQLLSRFEEVLNTLLKNPQLDVYVTGSNARFLSKDVITTFRGRGDEVRVHPLSFAEFMSGRPSEQFMEASLNEYMLMGGLPQLLSMNTERQKKDYLRMLYANTYLIDIKERYGIRYDDNLEELVDVIASNIGSFTNPLKIANTFNSAKQGRMSRDTVKVYLDHLQDAFLIERSVRYDIKGRRYIGTPVKYYFEDLGLRNARLNFRQSEPTHLMENLIYNELRLRGYSVDVGQLVLNARNAKGMSERRNLEVDFVCNKGYDRVYVQSAFAMPTPEKREQEFASLRHIGDSFQKVVIVGGMQPTYRNDDGILVLNVFDFLLNRVVI